MRARSGRAPASARAKRPRRARPRDTRGARRPRPARAARRPAAHHGDARLGRGGAKPGQRGLRHHGIAQPVGRAHDEGGPRTRRAHPRARRRHLAERLDPRRLAGGEHHPHGEHPEGQARERELAEPHRVLLGGDEPLGARQPRPPGHLREIGVRRTSGDRRTRRSPPAGRPGARRVSMNERGEASPPKASSRRPGSSDSGNRAPSPARRDLQRLVAGGDHGGGRVVEAQRARDLGDLLVAARDW